MLGERSDQRGLGKRTGCIWTTWGGTPSTVCWRRCGAGCSGTPISPGSTAPTTAGTACRPACWPRPCSSVPRKVSDAEAKARADFDLRWKVALGIEVEDRLCYAAGVPRPTDPARQGARGVRVQPETGPGVRLPEKAEHGWRWTRPTSWAGAQSRTPATCWPTGSSN